MCVRPTGRGRLTAEERVWLEGLVREQGPRLLAYVRRAYGSLPDPEDIVSEAFCRAAANIHALRATHRKDLYVLTITRNICRDRFRHLRPESPLAERPEPLAQGAAPPDALAADERCTALRRAVASLPDHLREVVVLRLSTDLHFEEIAELLAIPLGTALSRMHTALTRLKRDLVCDHGA